MTLGYRLHTIISGGEKLKPGVVGEFSADDYREMLALGAVRAPTKDELALYHLANGTTGEAEPVAPAEISAAEIKATATEEPDPTKTKSSRAKKADASDEEALV